MKNNFDDRWMEFIKKNKFYIVGMLLIIILSLILGILYGFWIGVIFLFLVGYLLLLT